MQELYHYGVQGMHWGIRRFQPYKGGQIDKGKFVGKTTGISLAASGGYGGGFDEDDRKRKQIQDAEDKIKDLQSKFDSVTPPDPTSSNYTDELHAYAKKRKELKKAIKQAKAERDSLLHSDDSCYLENSKSVIHMRVIDERGLVWDESSYLSHHGIQGQKWGKKNGPPYPLSAGAHSAAEKKAGWKDSLGSSSSTNKGSKKATSKQGKVNKAVSALKKKIQDIPPEKKEKAKRIAKTALKVAGGVAIAGLVGYGAAKYIVNPMMYNKLRNDFIQKAVKAHKLDIVRQASENDFLRLTGRGRASESMLDYLQERAIKNFNRWNDADLVKRKAGNVLKAYAPGHGSDWVKFRRQIDHIRYLMGK